MWHGYLRLLVFWRMLPPGEASKQQEKRQVALHVEELTAKGRISRNDKERQTKEIGN